MAPRKGSEKASWEVDADKPKPKGETRARRSYCVKELITSPAPGIETLYDLIQYASRTHGTKNALASRPIIKTINEEKEITKKKSDGTEYTEKKNWTYFKLGSFDWINYQQLEQKVKDVGSGLRELGVAGEGETFFNIYGQTSRNWLIMAHACGFSAVTICTAYDSLGPSGLSHSLSEPSVRSMFTNADLLPTVVKIIHECPTVKLIVYDGEADQAILKQLSDKRPDINVVTIDEVEELGKKNPKEPIRAKPNDVYCCMYTSGSTGTPKGVLLTHSNIVAAVGAIWHLLYDLLEPTDTFLAFLPLAHILEFIVEMAWIFAGIPIGYGRVKTLTDTSVRESNGDILEFRPSIMVGVPAVWELIRKGVQAKVEKSGAVKKSIFNHALFLKQLGRDWKIPGLAGLTDAVVFNAVKAQTGGRLKIALSGGGSLSAHTQEFVNNAVVHLIQGYGLTESVAMCAILHPAWFSYGSCGAIVPSCEVKLVDVPDAGYLSTNKLPQGEVWIRGASVTRGYFKRPDLDAESFVDGWFKTGDVGQFNADGTLSIIDRIKNLVKLSGGEYIAVEKLEAVYKSSMIVLNGAILANPQHDKPAMLVAVNHPNFLNFVKAQGLGSGHDDNLEELCKRKDVLEAVLKELNSVGKKQGFKGLEMLEAVILTPDEWTPQNGFLTAAQKLQRKTIEKHYEKEIKAVYG